MFKWLMTLIFVLFFTIPSFAAAVNTQQDGVGLGSVVTLNCSTGMTCTKTGNRLDMTSSGGGGSYTDTQARSATGWTDSGTSVYTTTSTDNVGIGTTTPQGSFDIGRSNIIYVGCADSISTVITNATAGDTIQLGSCTYSLAAELAISKSLNILGTKNTIISTGANNARVFNITSDNVNISNIKVTGTNPADAFIYANCSGGTSCQNINLSNVYVSLTETTSTYAVVYFDAYGVIDNLRVENTSSQSSGQPGGLLLKYEATNDTTGKVSLKNSKFLITDTNASFSGQVRGFMHWHNGASVPKVDTILEVDNVNAVCVLSAGGGDTECMQNQGPNAAYSAGVVGRDITYVQNSYIDGTTYSYTPCLTTQCRDYRIDDYAITYLKNVTFGSGQGSSQNNGLINNYGYIRAASLIGTQPSQANAHLNAPAALDLTGAIGGDKPGTGAQTGLVGGGFSIVGGKGGTATAATTTATGGAGAAGVLTAGAGADVSISSSTTNVGGSGGALTLTSGAGGTATNGTGTNTGGSGGDITFNSGTNGTGATANGGKGNIIFKVGGTQKMTIDRQGNVGIGTVSPEYGLTLNTSMKLKGTNFFCISDDCKIGMYSTAATNGDFQMTTNGAASFTINNANKNVGIGTINPRAKLDVVGDEVRFWTGAGTDDNALASGELYVEGDLEVDGTVYMASCSGAGCGAGGSSGWTDGGTNVYTTATTDTVGIGTTTPNSTTLEIVKQGSTVPLKISGSASGNGNLFIVTSAGNVGIGTTTAPANALVVNGTIQTVSTSAGSVQLTEASANGANTVTISAPSSLTGDRTCTLEDDSTPFDSCVTASGGASGWTDGGTNVYTTATTDNVGIGTTTPTANLEVVTHTVAPLMISSTATGDGNQLIVLSGGNVGIGTTAPVGGFVVMNGNVGIGTWSPTGKLQVGGTGNVGIGTLNPQNTLQVNGTFQVDNASGIGWTWINGADNTACNTICTSGCVMGFLNATGTAITQGTTCSDATADECLCAGPS